MCTYLTEFIVMYASIIFYHHAFRREGASGARRAEWGGIPARIYGSLYIIIRLHCLAAH